MLARIIGWALVAFIVFYLVTNPDGAAGVVHSLLNDLRDAGHSLAELFNSL